MGRIVEDFRKQFGETVLLEVLKHAGLHSGQLVPQGQDEKLVFALLEILDFQCYKYEELPEGLTRENIEQFLLKHREEVLNMKIPPPSFLGVLAGAFDFLVKRE